MQWMTGEMISDLDESLRSRYFPKVTNEKTCHFASCACAFKSSGYSFLEVKFGQSLKKHRNWINQPGSTITCRPIYPVLHWTDHESDYAKSDSRLDLPQTRANLIWCCRVPDIGLCTNVKFLMLRFDWRASNQSNYTVTSCSWANRVRQNAWDWLQAISFLPSHSPFSFTPPHVSQFLTHLRHACSISPPGKGNEPVATQAKLQKEKALNIALS